LKHSTKSVSLSVPVDAAISSSNKSISFHSLFLKLQYLETLYLKLCCNETQPALLHSHYSANCSPCNCITSWLSLRHTHLQLSHNLSLVPSLARTFPNTTAFLRDGSQGCITAIPLCREWRCTCLCSLKYD